MKNAFLINALGMMENLYAKNAMKLLAEFGRVQNLVGSARRAMQKKDAVLSEFKNHAVDIQSTIKTVRIADQDQLRAGISMWNPVKHK